MPRPPVDDQISIGSLTTDPYSFYRQARASHPVVTVTSVGRTMLTKAADTKYVKDNWELFSSDDPNTPMRRAFQAHTLMRKDGRAHNRERTAMAAAFSPRNLRNVWTPIYEKVADDYIGRLPRGETVDPARPRRPCICAQPCASDRPRTRKRRRSLPVVADTD